VIVTPRLRRALALKGITPATLVPEASIGRAEDAAIRVAELVEDTALAHHAVGAAEPWPGSVAFLDGIQRSELVGYCGSTPLLGAEIAAAVRERRDGRLTTAVAERRRYLVGRADALAQVGDVAEGLELLPTGAKGPVHPTYDLACAQRAIDSARGNLELVVGDRYRARSDGWLVVDGSLSVSPTWAGDSRTIGISKSHATLPFDGADLDHYLRLPDAHRSSIFAPAQGFAPVRAWALRLWDWTGRDLFYGLIRVEVSPGNGTSDVADRLSRWLLAERAPISAPDRRWDRLLYGIHAVEDYLRARRATS
jgi:hypothetical protein